MKNREREIKIKEQTRTAPSTTAVHKAMREILNRHFPQIQHATDLGIALI